MLRWFLLTLVISLPLAFLHVRQSARLRAAEQDAVVTTDSPDSLAREEPPTTDPIPSGPDEEPYSRRNQDRTSSVNQAQVDALIPMVERARSMLPAVKKRFKKGLGKGTELYLTIRLHDPNGRMEQVYARIVSWKKEEIVGIISNEMSLTTHQKGDILQIAEKDVIDWTITTPDGDEEGNIIGKYLEEISTR